MIKVWKHIDLARSHPGLIVGQRSWRYLDFILVGVALILHEALDRILHLCSAHFIHARISDPGQPFGNRKREDNFKKKDLSVL